MRITHVAQGDGTVHVRTLSNPRVPKIMIEGGLCRESERAIAVNAFYFHDRFVCLCTQITNQKSQKITEREIDPLFLPRAAFDTRDQA